MRQKAARATVPASTKQPSQAKLGDPSANGQPVGQEAVRVRAYQKWEAAGKPGGDGVSFWLDAERELLQAK